MEDSYGVKVNSFPNFALTHRLMFGWVSGWFMHVYNFRKGYLYADWPRRRWLINAEHLLCQLKYI